ncbi:MAG: 2,3-bisphosphoglycerate-independent phosphoglycerate mutase [Nitrospirota bacterium]
MAFARPLLLIILDGWGINPKKEGNAIALADPPFYQHLLKAYPNTTLSASGTDVGLPDGQMGNSEVGHANIGAGRIVYQYFTRINKAISEGTFQTDENLLKSLSGAGTLHLIGLLSDGGVHSHIDHLMAILEVAREKKVESLVVHAILDGRDTAPKSALLHLKRLADALKNAPPESYWRIGTVMGRYYAMDRDARWDRVQKAYNALVLGEGTRTRTSEIMTVLEARFKVGETDEFVQPIVLCENESPVGKIEDEDRVIFYNFRADRARLLTRALIEPELTAFKREAFPRLSSFLTMTAYDKNFRLPVIFSAMNSSRILGEVVSCAGLLQCRLAETEKYAHVTYFFNGGREAPYEGEERILIPSPRDVATYDLKPAMSAHELTKSAIEAIKSKRFDLIVMNYANPDMVGHSGNLKAAIDAVRVIDSCLEKVIGALLSERGIAMVTADHGNLEQMIDYQTHEPHTAHTTLPVPFILISDDPEIKKMQLRSGIHANIAPTILQLMNIPIPDEMDQPSLIVPSEMDLVERA